MQIELPESDKYMSAEKFYKEVYPTVCDTFAQWFTFAECYMNFEKMQEKHRNEKKL